MKPTQELDISPASQPLAVREATPIAMMEAMIASGITAENVAAFTELVKLKEHMEDRNAVKQFAESFVRLQSELPTISGTRPVLNKDGTVRFRYANFDDIDDVVRPICLKHGFTYAFRETGIENGRITVTMTLQHSGGHYREIPCSVRVGSGPPGASEPQADMSGHAYAQRGALESGLSLRIVGSREDAGVTTGVVTAEQAEELSRRVAMINANKEAFLKFAGAKSFAEIPASNYEILDRFLTSKEKKQ